MTQKIVNITAIKDNGYVFTDLGCNNVEELNLKAKIATAINSIVQRRCITQMQAANVLGLTQPQVSNIKNGKLKRFSVERLCKALNVLGRDVDIVIKEKSADIPREPRTKVITV